MLGCLENEVPLCGDGDPDLWDWDELQKWLASTHSYQLIEVKLNPGSVGQVAVGVTCILSGKSPSGEGYHAVLGRFQPGGHGFELVHDPHPEQIWLNGEPICVAFLVPTRTPAELVVDLQSHLQ